MKKIPDALVKSLLAVVLLMGAGVGGYVADESVQAEARRNEYAQRVAADADISDGVKISMVMGAFYESSGKHIGTPYIDKNGKGRPLTVCNGLTGHDVVAGRHYTQDDCYRLEKSRYKQSEAAARRLLRFWGKYDSFVQATFIDFIHNKGEANFATSTMRTRANADDLVGACRQNPRWNLGTVNGVKQVLPGLQTRGDANGDICESWRIAP